MQKAMAASSRGTPSIRTDSSPEESLAKLKRELERLGYALSHDLQSPVRVIHSCCDEISAAVKDGSEVSAETAALLASESQRMKDMVGHLIDYVQLQTHDVRHSRVDCNELMETVRMMLAGEIDRGGATLHYGHLPEVWGHQGRLTRLFASLVDNAIKFRSSDPCVVEITAQDEGDYCRFTVTDNGIGIDEDNHELIFRMFKRLHPSGHYAGNGSGLALAKKIIDSHQGEIGLESTIGSGSRFWFTLPVREIGETG